MAIINPDGLFAGDRLRHCSNAAQLHWPRLFLASDGFGRLELNYHKIVARAYATFNPVPSEQEILGCIQEYLDNYLLFGYAVDGQAWGQWDTPAEFLPRYKTAGDKRSPVPPEPALSEWKRRYRSKSKTLPKCFENFPETFLHGVGVGGGVGDGDGDGEGKTICSTADAIERQAAGFSSAEIPQIADQSGNDSRVKSVRGPDGMTDQQEQWWSEWWPLYWRHVAKAPARRAFAKHVRTPDRFNAVMTATKAQTPEMLSRPADKRPHPATWLNAERWTDEVVESQPAGDGAKHSMIDGALGELYDAGAESRED